MWRREAKVLDFVIDRVVTNCIVLYLQPVLNPESYDGARVLEASGRPLLVWTNTSRNRNKVGGRDNRVVSRNCPTVPSQNPLSYSALTRLLHALAQQPPQTRA